MGLGLRTFNKKDPRFKRSLLERFGTGVFDALDAPGNATRSLVRFGQTGEWDYVWNALNSMEPFAESDYIAPSEITGSESYGKNLLTAFALDPLIFVGGVGSLTKAGKAVKSLQSARAYHQGLLKYQKVLPHISRIKRIGSARHDVKALKAIAKGFKGETKRSILRLGIPFSERLGLPTLDLGNYRNVQNLAQKLRVLPDPRLPGLMTRAEREQGKIRSLTSELAGTKNPGRRARLEGQIENLRESVTGRLERIEALGTKSLISPNMQVGVRKWIKGQRRKHPVLLRKGKFRTKARSGALEAQKEVMLTELAGDLYKQTINNEVIAQRLEALRKKSGQFSQVDYNRRILKAAEYRHLVDGSIDLEGIVSRKAKELVAEYKPKFKKHKLGSEARQKTIDEFMGKAHGIKEAAVAREMQLAGASKHLKGITTEELQFIRDYFHSFERFIPIAQRLGIPLEKLSSSMGVTSFVPRIISKEAVGFKSKHEAKAAVIQNELNAKFSGSIQRTLYPELDIVTLNETVKKQFGIKFNWFNEDVAEIIAKRRAEQFTVMHRAAAANVIVNTWTKGRVPAATLFKKLGLDPKKAPDTNIPVHIYNDATKIDQFFIKQIDPKGIGRNFMRWMASFNRSYQVLLTSPFPAFHHRNMINNMAMNAVAGVNSKHYFSMHNLIRKAARGELKGADAKLWEELNRFRIVRAGQFEEYRRFVQESPLLSKYDEFFNRPFSAVLDGLGKQRKAPLRREQYNLFTGRAYGTFLEEWSRGAHYLSMRAKGMPAVESMRSVNKWLFDPTNITQFERQFMRPNILFYTWMRNNIPLMLKTLITQPRYGSTYAKITGMGEEEIPNYLRRGFTFKAPDIVGPNEYVSRIGLGIEDLFLANVSSADPSGSRIGSMDQIRRLVGNVLTLASPVLRIPTEALFTQKESYTGRPYSDIDAPDLLLRMLPISRFVGTQEKLFGKFDPDKGFFQNLFSTGRMMDLMTGIRTYKVNPKLGKVDTIKRRMHATGKFEKFNILIPKKAFKKDAQVKKMQRELREMLKKK